MADQNILGNWQAVNEFVQQQTKHIEGQPVRVYPFKIVSGLSYFTNRGQKPLGSSPGATSIAPDNTAKTSTIDPYGAYTGMTTMFSGAKPIMCYWFGVVNCTIGEDENGNNASNKITTKLNASVLDPSLNNIPVGQPLPVDAFFTPDTFKNPFNNNQPEYPWKELGLEGFSVGAGKEQHSETLDNLKVACYDTTYDYTMYSTSWVPNFQEINEFVYFIIDRRCACPLALRITSIEPHYDAVGILQDCTICFSSVNQYYNSAGRNVLTYVKFGAVGDGYAFPKEILYANQNDENAVPSLQTIIDPQLLNNSMGGVNQVEVKNNSLTGQFGALIYGHPYVPFYAQLDDTGKLVITKTTYQDDYLIPWRFTPPCTDLIDVSSETVHSIYDLAMNMLVINEQIWKNWKSTKEFYNVTQNFTFQGGLAFDDPTASQQQVQNPQTGSYSEEWISSLLGSEANVYRQTFGTAQYNTWVANAPGLKNLGDKGYGSQNIATVMLSNANGTPLDVLSDPNHTWNLTLSANTSISGFALPQTAVFDFRGTGFTAGTFDSTVLGTLTSGGTNALKAVGTAFQFLDKCLDTYYANGFQPNSNSASETYSIQNMSAGPTGSMLPQTFFALNSWSMINVHQLEINYRDGIVYTNQDQGHNGIINDMLDKVGGLADKWLGYTPGYANFFMNTYTRTYNLLLPHMITMLAEQYINPTDAVYNTIPLDIFANTNDNNTSVGQLKYMSGYQMILTNWFNAKSLQGNQNITYLAETTTQMRSPRITNDDGSLATRYVNPQSSSSSVPNAYSYFTGANTNNQPVGFTTSTNTTPTPLAMPYNSLSFFQSPAEPLDATLPGHISYVIDEINVKQLGISNIHITYWKEVPTQESLLTATPGQAYAKVNLQSVGEEWLENTAKMMNNTSYIDNDIDYYVYDDYNTQVKDNSEPYLAFQFPADPIYNVGKSTQKQQASLSPGVHVIKPSTNSNVLGVNFTDNTTNQVYGWNLRTFNYNKTGLVSGENGPTGSGLTGMKGLEWANNTTNIWQSTQDAGADYLAQTLIVCPIYFSNGNMWEVLANGNSFWNPQPQLTIMNKAASTWDYTWYWTQYSQPNYNQTSNGSTTYTCLALPTSQTKSIPVNLIADPNPLFSVNNETDTANSEADAFNIMKNYNFLSAWLSDLSPYYFGSITDNNIQCSFVPFTFNNGINQWWLDFCNNASTTPTNAYLPGTIDICSYVSWIATIPVLNGANAMNSSQLLPTSNRASNPLNYWLSNVWFYFRYVGYNNSNQTSQLGGYAIYDGIIAPYIFQCVFYTFNFTSLISQMENEWEEQVPTLNNNPYAEQTGVSINWNYVLVPHGQDPSTYTSQWIYATANPKTYPWVNSNNAVILIEANGNNVVFTTDNYQALYTPTTVSAFSWYNGVPYGNGEAPLQLHSYGYLSDKAQTGNNDPSITYNFLNLDSSELISKAAAMYDADSGWMPQYYGNFHPNNTYGIPTNPAFPSMPYSALGLASSLLIQIVPPAGANMSWTQTLWLGTNTNWRTTTDSSNPGFPSDNQNGGLLGLQTSMPLSAQPLFVNGIVSNWAQQNNITQTDGTLLQNWTSFKLLNAGWFMNNSASTQGFTYPQTKPTWASGSYDMYIFYSVNNSQ